ncbi:MAG: PilZ domain-containing protein [Armatimonadetes bacterium]|nr:PilZ domain-containing protein [Armatimonadota bacterium]
MLFNLFRKWAKKKGDEPKKADAARPATAPEEERNVDIPNRFHAGLEMKAIPERQPGTPKAWHVRIFKLDREGVWIRRQPQEEQPLEAAPGEVMALVLFEEKEHKRFTYDCPVLRVVAGTPEAILVGPPTKIEKSEAFFREADHRRHFRVSFRLPAECRSVMGSELGPPVSAHTKDISMSGLAVISPKAFPEGTEVEVRILSWNFPLKLRAYVVRCQALGDTSYTVAVSFPPDLSTISRDLISQFILENQRYRA